MINWLVKLNRYVTDCDLNLVQCLFSLVSENPFLPLGLMWVAIFVALLTCPEEK